MSERMQPQKWDTFTARDIQRFCETLAEKCDAISEQFEDKGDYESLIRARAAHERGQALWMVRNMIEEELYDVEV